MDEVNAEEAPAYDVDISFHSSYSEQWGESTPLPIHIATHGSPVVMFALTHPLVHPLGAMGIDIYSLGWSEVANPKALIEWMEHTLELLKASDFVNAEEFPDKTEGASE